VKTDAVTAFRTVVRIFWWKMCLKVDSRLCLIECFAFTERNRLKLM